MDSPAGDYFALGGEEVVNVARTVAYLEAGYGPPGMSVNGGCSCSNIRELAGCDPLPYSIPSGKLPIVPPASVPVDAAPWYDPSVPESADFAGFYPVDFDGLGATFTRERFQRINGGAVLGKQVAQERLMTWRGYLFGRTACAVQYGLRWLTAQLSGVGCDCDTEDMDLLICCPSVTGNITGCLGLPSTQFGSDCAADPTANANAFGAFRTLKEVGLASGPIVLSTRKTGCGSGVDSGCADESVIIEVEFSMVAGSPYLYGCPTTVCSKMKWTALPGACPAGPGVVSYGVGGPQTFIEVPNTACTNINCEDPDCSADPSCVTPSVPTFKGTVSKCGACDALDPVSFCCSVKDDTFGEFFDGVPRIELYSGTKAMKNTKIKFFNNPLEKPCDDIAKEKCDLCDMVQIRYIPPESTLVIDGLTRSITLQCPGNEAGDPADHLTVSPFSWSTIQCMNSCICIETDGFWLDFAKATATITIIPRQM